VNDCLPRRIPDGFILPEREKGKDLNNSLGRQTSVKRNRDGYIAGADRQPRCSRKSLPVIRIGMGRLIRV